MTQAKKLKFGDPAPPLAIATWLKGEPVERFEPGTVYVVEFWATWCGPCVQVMPHLSQLQREHTDVVFIGVNCTGEDPTKVARFVAGQGDKMAYRVGIEQVREQSADANKAESAPRPVGVMGETWMRASREVGIPRAFVVGKDGRIAWINHPGFLSGETLHEVASGVFDIAKAALVYELNNSLNEAVHANDPDRVLAGCDELLKVPGTEQYAFLPMQFEMAIRKKDRVLANKFVALIVETHRQKMGEPDWLEKSGRTRWRGSAVRAVLEGKFDFETEVAVADACERIAALSDPGDVAAFFSAVEEFEAAYPERAGMFAWKKWNESLKIGDGLRMNRAARAVADHNSNDSEIHNYLAWSLIDPNRPIAGADFQLAKLLALRAVELSQRRNPDSLDTAARACFLVGDLAQAVELQRVAIERLLKEDRPEDIKAGMSARLDQYLAALAKPPAAT